MKELVEFLKKRGLLFKEFKEIDRKKLGIKKKIEIFTAIDVKDRFILVLKIDKKSRFLTKDALFLVELLNKINGELEINFKRVIVVLTSDNICSKAKELLKEYGWSIYVM